MKRTGLVLAVPFILSMLAVAVHPSEKPNERARYANRPDDLVPYSRARIYRDTYAQPPEFRERGGIFPIPRWRP